MCHRNRINVLLHQFNHLDDSNPAFGDLRPLFAYPCTEDEISFIFNVNVSRKEARDYIAAHALKPFRFNIAFLVFKRRMRGVLDQSAWTEERVLALKWALLHPETGNDVGTVEEDEGEIRLRDVFSILSFILGGREANEGEDDDDEESGGLYSDDEAAEEHEVKEMIGRV
jgi:hypothetical protein